MKKLMYLPHELIIQILLRLPVKSLIRFKCVCKLWLTLVSDPHFAISHFQLNSATPNPRILIISTPASLVRSIDLEASLHDDSASAELNLNFIHPQSSVEIKGSCNGFIYDFASMCLWNPSNGVHRQIPSSPYNSNCFYYLDGFGANTWKEMEGIYLPYMNAGDNSRVGSLVNGAIHWVAFNSDTSMDVIVAFDLAERKLVEMFLPDDFNIDSNFYELWVFGEFLSLWVRGEDAVEIWVMKEYKVQSSWTMTLVLPMDDYFSPICCTIKGDIIGTGSTGLVKYDDKGQLLEHRSYGVVPHGSQVAMYVESLLSLPVDSV
ncbi:F-box/kelch-repeat protein At3g06240-like [Vicia villosa]|uniref:F-box/kelch-repeat protein At3g06240-like n=1 Tax=Vicia villosa TaxID=3911 RepID=UPI00273CC010|nr:F-box/kelch-repeat protein At3g06240-like [Vicia villosa]